MNAPPAAAMTEVRRGGKAAAEAAIELRDISLSLSLRGKGTGRFELRVEAFAAWHGEAVALIGESGSGKSTLLNLIGLAQKPGRADRFLLRPRDGAVHDVAALWAQGADAALTGLRARHQGYVLQQGGLLPFLSVRDNIGLSLAMQGRADAGAVEEVAASLGISRLLGRGIGEISVGQRQRVAIARALVHEPDMLLADEPTANVHPSMADEVMGLLREQAARHRVLLIMATHDVAPEAVPGEPDCTRSTVLRRRVDAAGGR